MKCKECDGIAKRRGFYQNKSFTVQRYECLKCGLSFSDKQPLDNLRVGFEQACQVLNLLAEGMGIRATSRLTGLHQQTVLNVLARAGIKAKWFLESKIANIKPESVQCDEMFSYVFCKEKNNVHHDPFIGDQYMHMAIDSKSKLIIAHVVGKRTIENTNLLLEKVRERVPERFTLATDGYEAYKLSVPRNIGKDVDYGVVVKQFAANYMSNANAERRYSPSRCTAIRKRVRRGNPQRRLISTSYIERANLSVRTFNRRYVRLTIGYSKKYEYHCHQTNLFAFHFNFCRFHSAHSIKGQPHQTPAMAAGIATEPMTFAQLLLTPN